MNCKRTKTLNVPMNTTEADMKYDPYSPESWDIEGHKTVNVDDMFFDDCYMIYLALDEITLEPVTGDPMETKLESVFWLSSKDMDVTMELTEREMIPYLGG